MGTFCTTGKAMGSTIIFGCGNILMGDDGYGPAVIAELQQHPLPAGVQAIDAGTGIREYLFDYLLDESGRPDTIIVLDAVDYPDKQAGDVFIIDSAAIPPKKIHDFSLHQFPTVNLLHELEQHTAIEVIIVAAQIEDIPTEIAPGLSPSIRHAVTVTCKKIKDMLREKIDEVIV